MEGESFRAWGELWYLHPLTEKQIADYELRPAHDNPEGREPVPERGAAKKPPIAEQMKEAGRMTLPLVNIHATVACYQREGQTTKYHRASLLERFDVMRRHYGLAMTLAMHAWFVVRAVLKRGRK